MTRTFYDSQGREVETRTPGPTSGDDTVTVTVYNDQNHTIWESVAFQSVDGATWIDPNGATDINGNAPAGTVTFSDALGRTIAVQDPNYGSSSEPGISCSTTLSGTYTSCANYSVGSPEGSTTIYQTASTFDANNHLSVSYVDALGRTADTQEYSGTGPVVSTTALVYSGKATRIYPQSHTSNGNVSGSNSTCVAIDMVFSNSTDLRDSGAVDQNGHTIHPAGQCGHLTLDSWNYVVSNIGAKVSGRTINRIDLGYDQANVTGGYRGYVDDIKISNPTSTTPLFATDLESGSMQPTWTNTVDTTSPGGNLVNIGGFSGSLTAPELGPRTERSHNGRMIKHTQTAYNALDKPTSVTVKDYARQAGQSTTSSTTTMTYDDLGRLLTEVDPDEGTFTYSYDADGHVTSVVQTSGSSSRTLGFNYDLLGRMTCEQTAAPTFNATGACSAGNPLLVNTYDTTMFGTQGTSDFPIGHLTQSVATTYYADGTSAIVTQQYQTDQRGRTSNEQMLLTLPSGWNIGTGLPLYQLAVTYNDADQVASTTATAGAASYSFSAVYDATTGVLQGLSSGTSSSSANLASLAYNEYAQLSSITLLNGGSTQIASTQYSYDGNQRPTSLTTNWLPGSGNSGEILGQSRTYDNASNVTNTNTFFSSVPGESGSGGTEAQNFCYNEQNELVWAGNGGTQPGANKGTCGSGTLASGLVGAGYTSPFAYTNLSQIWQGPLNGGSTTYQYLYCNSAPHQLSGVYPLGTTCSTKGSATALYTAGYDAWGNETSRTYNSTTATLSYDALNRLTEYSVSSSNQEFYVYDASGERVLKRSTSAGTTTLTAYAYGLQELTYTGAGVFSSQTGYYGLAGHLIGSTNGSAMTYYGNQRYVQGALGTDKGYTGQFYDAVSGLYYYNARYYDPVMVQFLSADNVQGNAQGMDPYAYVADNPETLTDPTGLCGVSSLWDMIDCDNPVHAEQAVQSGSLTSGKLEQIGELIIEEAAKAAEGQFWLWVVVAFLVVAFLIVAIALLFFAKSKKPTIPHDGKPVETRTKKYVRATDQGIANDLKSYAQKANTGDNTDNFGAADLYINGKANPNKEHKQAVFGDLGGHTEALIIRWAKGLLETAREKGIKSVHLVLFTFKAPCEALCAPNLRNNTWRDQLARAAGFAPRDYNKVTIVVFTQFNNAGNGAKPWP